MKTGQTRCFHCLVVVVLRYRDSHMMQLGAPDHSLDRGRSALSFPSSSPTLSATSSHQNALVLTAQVSLEKATVDVPDAGSVLRYR